MRLLPEAPPSRRTARYTKRTKERSAPYFSWAFWAAAGCSENCLPRNARERNTPRSRLRGDSPLRRDWARRTHSRRADFVRRADLIRKADFVRRIDGSVWAHSPAASDGLGADFHSSGGRRVPRRGHIPDGAGRSRSPETGEARSAREMHSFRRGRIRRGLLPQKG